MTPELEKSLRGCTRLPSLPTVGLKVLELAQVPEDEDLDLSAQLGKVIEADPALSAQLMRVSNSPLFRGQSEVRSVARAIGRLGQITTISLALSFVLVASTRSGGGEYRLDLGQFWRRSLLVATGARVIARRLELVHPEETFLGGLLSDIGLLVLDRVATGYDSRCSHDELVEREREALGTDHAEVGCWLAGRWGLPEFFQVLVLCSEDPTVVPPAHSEYQPAAFCVALAGLVAQVWMEPGDPDHWQHLVERSRDWLGLDEAGLHEIVVRVGDEFQAFAGLLDLPPMDAEEIEGLQTLAGEVLLLRNLQVLQRADEARSQVGRLREEAFRDPLTKLHNRRFVMEYLPMRWADSQRDASPLAVVMVDADRFKQVNDRYGHPAGDTILTRLAMHLVAGRRQTDTVARWGGEEFLLILPRARARDCMAILEGIRRSIEEEVHDDLDGLRVTVSAGVAVHQDRGRAYQDYNALIQAADQALYRAKMEGRNRVCLVGDPPLESALATGLR